MLFRVVDTNDNNKQYYFISFMEMIKWFGVHLWTSEYLKPFQENEIIKKEIKEGIGFDSLALQLLQECGVIVHFEEITRYN